MPTWISDYTHYKVWDHITYHPLASYYVYTIEVGYVILSHTLLGMWLLDSS